jgi:hypothetical protein
VHPPAAPRDTTTLAVLIMTVSVWVRRPDGAVPVSSGPRPVTAGDLGG